jgi:hypothetical protein
LQELGQLSDISFPLQLFYLTTSLQQLQKGKRLEFNYKATQWGKNKRKKKKTIPNHSSHYTVDWLQAIRTSSEMLATPPIEA